VLSLVCVVDAAGIRPEELQAVALCLPSTQLDLLLAKVIIPSVLCEIVEEYLFVVCPLG
jgi:hypothetical protein